MFVRVLVPTAASCGTVRTSGLLHSLRKRPFRPRTVRSGTRRHRSRVLPGEPGSKINKGMRQHRLYPLVGFNSTGSASRSRMGLRDRGVLAGGWPLPPQYPSLLASPTRAARSRHPEAIRLRRPRALVPNLPPVAGRSDLEGGHPRRDAARRLTRRSLNRDSDQGRGRGHGRAGRHCPRTQDRL